jgi:DNA topoisomerase-1
MSILIVAEKPSVALRIASALSDKEPERKRGSGKTSYYEMKVGKEEVFVAAAVGHIFTIKQAGGGRGYPVLDVDWAPSYTVGRGSEFTKDYFDTLKELAAKCDSFINACDYDVEGTVIGTNVIRFTKEGGLQHAKRMKFSTTTNKDLVYAYKNLQQLDMGNFYAGEARHILDWLWGINLSRALTGAVGLGKGESLSIGRVQGPTLAMLAKREVEIATFVSKPFWRVTAVIKEVEFLNTLGDIFNKVDATKAFGETNTAADGAVVTMDRSEEEIRPNPPFDLTSLQVEASRVLRMDPSTTLAVAQSLYERSFISYPRTSSQKLPAALGLQDIIKELGKNPQFADLVKRLIAEKRFVPVEGNREDEAHPAIFPTGIMPTNLAEMEKNLYGLIASRFLACFAKSARTERVRVVAAFGSQTYAASGRMIKERGWLDFYSYAKFEEREMPQFAEKEKVRAKDVAMKELKTLPPKRFTKAGAISELEKRNLGTKATRAAIVDTLFKRKYLDGQSITVTKFGLSVYDALSKNCPMIVSEDTTKRLEEDMDEITRGKKNESEVIEEGKTMLLEALDTFDKHREQITESMRSSLRQMNGVGKCPEDNGEMVVRWSKIGRRFAGCGNYPSCTRTYPLPQKVKISPTGKNCATCGAPIILVQGRGASAFEYDINPECPENKRRAAESIAPKPASSLMPPRDETKSVVQAAVGVEPQKKVKVKRTKKAAKGSKTKKKGAGVAKKRGVE